MRWIVLCLFVAACGSDLSATQACNAEAKDRCSALMRCSAADFQRRYPDEATCESRTALACAAALTAPKTANTPDHEDACGGEIAGQACDAFLSNVEPPTACIPPKGTAANGAACSYAAQCSSGFCAVPDSSFCGTCADAPAVGTSCAMQGCGPTLECVASTMTCQAPVAQGGACSRDLPCIEGQSCVGATQTAMGTCTPQGTTVGATCDARQITGPNCSAAAGLTCDTATNMCAMEALVATGQPCGVINNVQVGCLAGGTCQRAGGTATGTCVAPAADGAACDATNGPFCSGPAKCISGTCQLPGSQSC